MNFRFSTISLLVASAVFSAGQAAASNLGKENFDFYANHVSQKIENSNGLTKATQKTSYTVNSDDSRFNWYLQDSRLQKMAKQLSAEKSQSTESIAHQYLTALYPSINAGALQQKNNSANQAELISLHHTLDGLTIARYQQTLGGFEIFRKEANLLLDKANRLVAASGQMINNIDSASLKLASNKQSFTLDGGEAIQKALYNMAGVDAFAVFDVAEKSGKYQSYNTVQSIGDFVLDNSARSKEVWYDLGHKLVPAYYIELAGRYKNDPKQVAYSFVISAENGDLLFRKNLVEEESFTYRVFTDNATDKALLDGPQGDELPFIGDINSVRSGHNRTYQGAKFQLVTLESAPFSQNDPWLPAGATTTDGNNVVAYLDIAGSDGFDTGDVSAETTSANTFDYAYDPTDPLSTSSQKAAVVNLFYMNNWLHDWFYDSGFDEAARNAQKDNYGRGGSANDAIKAEGQDQSGRNNANMSTPADGAQPRMQMYLYDGQAIQGTHYDLTLSGVTGLTNPTVALASFGLITFASITGDVVAYTDATAPTFDACEVPTNGAALSGKIALVDRGACNFTVKVKNAQDAGAVAVLVANNRDGDAVSLMGGSDSSVSIPSFMVSQNDGATIRSALAGGTVTATMFRNSVPDQDGTFDNLIVAHEWGHYISNRLIGNAAGLDNQQGRGMGEGWGDFLAILTSIKASDQAITGNDQYQGLYPMYGWADQSPYFGIRRVPYSTDMTRNALTFKHVENGVALPTSHPVQFGSDGANNSAVHRTGEIWAVTLHEIYASLLNDSRYTFQQAQDKMKQYLVASLKMTPSSPTIIEARDAWLAVGLAADAGDYEHMLNAFAKRGMGAGAIAPHRFSTTHFGVVESFTGAVDTYQSTSISLDTSYNDGNLGFCTDDSILDVGETAKLDIVIKNTGKSTLTNTPVSVSSSADVTFSNGGQTTIASLAPQASTTVSFLVTLDSAQTGETVSITVNFPEKVNGDVIVEPSSQSLSTVTNFTVAKVASKTSEDFSNPVVALADWTQVVASSANDTAAAETFSVVDVSETIEFSNTAASLGKVLYGNDNRFSSDVSFVSPDITVGSSGSFTMSFEHAHAFEVSFDDDGNPEYWDTGVVEISVAGGAWQDVTAAGGSFTANGYNGQTFHSSSPFGQGRDSFAGQIHTPRVSTVDFGTALNGQTVKLRFRIGSDASVGAIGWIIDNVSFTNIAQNTFSGVAANTTSCNVTAPVAHVAQSTINVRENVAVQLDASGSTDPQNDTLTFSWTQTSGPSVSLTNANQALASFTSPDVNADTTLVFQVAVSDGSEQSTATVTVNVEANQAPVAQVAQSSITVTEGNTVTLNASSSTDANGDSLTFSWAQTSGTSVSINNATSASASFTAPQVTANTTLAFEVTVSDGEFESKATVNVTVQNQTTNPPPSGGGGGGSVSFITLLALSLLTMIRRRRKQS